MDLGASPGGWSQVALQNIKGGKVIAIDIVPMEELEGVCIIQGDIRDHQVLENLQNECKISGRVIDVLLSDMSHPFVGTKSADVPRMHGLVEFALKTALLPQILKPGGIFVAKYLQGEGQEELKESVAYHFDRMHTFKPKVNKVYINQGM